MLVLAGSAEVMQLRDAMNALAAKLPSANPGPPQGGDPGAVTDQMLSAIILLSSRISFPSEVKTALQVLALGGSYVPTNVKTAAKAAISRYAGALTTAVKAYAAKLGAGSVTVGTKRYPVGTIATPTSGGYRLAIPLGTSVGFSGLGDSVITLEGAAQLMATPAATHTEVESEASLPANATVVDKQTFEAKTGSRPFYKTWWGIGLIVVVAAGVSYGGYRLLRKRR
jgi:hypothetical protein